MSSAKDDIIEFKIGLIDTSEFALIEDNYDENYDGDNSLTSSIEFGTDSASHVLAIRLKFVFEQNKKPFLICAVEVGFAIEDESWRRLISKEANELIIPLNFAFHMALLATGTARGIIHEKTVKSRIKSTILPPIDLTGQISEDVRLDLSEEN